MAPPKPKFIEGEKVLCFHGPLIYEAKCLKSSITKEKTVRYFIHYAGWNKNWDEWVPESRVLKYNDDNVQMQKDVQKTHAAQPNKNKKTPAKGRKSEAGGNTSSTTPRDESRASTPAGNEPATPPAPSSRTATKSSSSETQVSASNDPVRKKRARVDPGVETEEQFLSKVEVRIKVPEELKVWLADDWDVITRQQKLANLPARVTVDTILNNYHNSKKSSKAHTAAKETILKDVVTGIKEYFNVALGCQLLYKFERPQYKEILQSNPDTPLSQIYGGIHLLRLFVKMGAMLAYTSLDEKSLQHVLGQIHDLLKYMVVNRSSLLSLQDYGNAPPEYHRNLM